MLLGKLGGALQMDPKKPITASLGVSDEYRVPMEGCLTKQSLERIKQAEATPVAL